LSFLAVRQASSTIPCCTLSTLGQAVMLMLELLFWEVNACYSKLGPSCKQRDGWFADRRCMSTVCGASGRPGHHRLFFWDGRTLTTCTVEPLKGWTRRTQSINGPSIDTKATTIYARVAQPVRKNSQLAMLDWVQPDKVVYASGLPTMRDMD
jgi:hypothetical protein